jgi:hypothetical protein
LHAEKVGVEAGREDGLVDSDLDSEGNNVRGVVEVMREEEEPFAQS